MKNLTFKCHYRKEKELPKSYEMSKINRYLLTLHEIIINGSKCNEIITKDTRTCCNY